MKKIIALLAFIFIITSGLKAQVTVSGILDTTVSMTAGAGESPGFSMGFEEYVNLRFQARLRDRGAVFGAVNLLAAAGDYAESAALMSSLTAASPMNMTAYVAGENYIAAIELERLYFRLRGEHIDLESGLMRLPFGYGQVWGSSDFLNPKNPLKPDARPRAVLGAALSWYPIDELKLLAFYAAPRNPFSNEGNGSFVGLSLDKHWSKVSIQGLYSFETPNEITDTSIQTPSSKYGIHRVGLSVKADVEVGLVLDTLYTYNHEAGTKWEGLSLSVGADYSFFDGNLIVLAEYLYNGKKSSTALGFGGSFSNNHYLSAGLTYVFNSFTNLSVMLISSFDDVSFTPVISFNHELFQGASLTITAQAPMDRDLFNSDGNRGEFGPIPPDELQPFKDIIGRRGSYFSCSARIRLRF